MDKCGNINQICVVQWQYTGVGATSQRQEHCEAGEESEIETSYNGVTSLLARRKDAEQFQSLCVFVKLLNCIIANMTLKVVTSTRGS